MRFCYERRMVVLSALLWGLLTAQIVPCAALAQGTKKVTNGKTPIPGFPNDTIKFTVTSQKPPNPTCDTNIDKKLQYWFDMTLCRTNHGDTTPVKFMICTMLNVDQKKKTMTRVIMYLDSGKWKCKDSGTVDWAPNVHLGCKEFTMSTNGQMLQGWDTTVTFPFRFTDAQIAASYTDIVQSAPGGIDTSTCKNMIGECKFLQPGNGAFPGNPNGTSSWWIASGGVRPVFTAAAAAAADSMDLAIPDTCVVVAVDTAVGDVFVDRLIAPTGNFYTMGYMDQDYPSLLSGDLTNAPIGATLIVKFPPSSGGGSHRFTVNGPVTHFELPFVIRPMGLMEDADEHTYAVVVFDKHSHYIDTNEVMSFKADVIAQGDTKFPDGRPLFTKGQWMHGIAFDWVWDHTPPRLIGESIGRSTDDPKGLVLNVQTVDDRTMTTSALFRYRVNGIRQPDQVLDFAHEPMRDDTVNFALQLGRMESASLIDSCEIYLKDLAGNMSHMVLPEFRVAGVPDAALAGYRLDEAVPNPFGRTARINFAIPHDGHVLLELYDAAGHIVATLLDADMSAGEHAALLDASSYNLTAGVYFYRLRSGAAMQVRSVVVQPER
ncbi:MAG TPA: T9SS type A sorting domain-containing protein [Candidatus Kapabacteria bacterium]|nr:T9SS type A sorting domain-containing protein [Candidatus Kapabacteria bacterium]